MEVNPGTLTGDKLRAYKRGGVNRLSIGLQSTENEELLALGRIHSREDFGRSYESAAQAGFENLNIDLMSGIPGQTCTSWQRRGRLFLRIPLNCRMKILTGKCIG